jgi:hypothetical protein
MESDFMDEYEQDVDENEQESQAIEMPESAPFNGVEIPLKGSEDNEVCV